MINIKYSTYKYAPETAAATVNGIKLDIHDTMVGNYICTGNHEKATVELKKLYRKQLKKVNHYCYCFFAVNSNQYYYVTQLSFTEKDDIKARLHCYKELKKHLINNPVEINIESGHFIPGQNSDIDVKKEYVKIDFSRLKKVKIIYQ